MLNAITGWQFGPKDCWPRGIVNIKRAVSNKLGLTREQDRMPSICTAALAEGSAAGIEPEMEKMLKSYYQFRGWDWRPGRPTNEKLLELGLNQVAAEMYP